MTPVAETAGTTGGATTAGVQKAIIQAPNATAPRRQAPRAKLQHKIARGGYQHVRVEHLHVHDGLSGRHRGPRALPLPIRFTIDGTSRSFSEHGRAAT
jgi:hypothetical protein